MANVHYRLGHNVDYNYLEIAERKGLGHPDTVIDGIMEEISRELCRKYIEEFGTVMHHNVDKGLIVGGEAHVGFGGGEIKKPAEIYLAGRAVYEAAGRQVNVEGIAMETARKYLEENFRHLDVDKDVVLIPKIREGSADLISVFQSRGGEVPLANDTSFGSGFAPYSKLESVVLEVERHLNSPAYKETHNFLGEDIKVMGLREGDRLKVTVAAAFVSAHVPDMKDYIDKKEGVAEDIRKLVSKSYEGDFEVFLNTADDYKRGSVYITKTGLSMEAGDDGEVGRGNRCSGLITPYRRMSLEAAAGKNPVNHVGKIYNVLANEIARDIVAQFDFVEAATFTIVSQIGRPINLPKGADLEVVLSRGYSLEDAKPKLAYVVDGWLENITEITNRIIYGKARVF
ncbi:MAG: methionine adenosyltransferase [Candidatus Micrarchaeota archaeon]|nr:methionine adenosyltransferase [Candidatus Micrarchaeota archaeon]